MTVKVVVKEYLEQLKESEQGRPVSQRRPIPTVEEFAKFSGISKTGFIDFTHNRTDSINRKVIDGVITLLRECGFETSIQDVLKYEQERVQ